ncbi:glyoxalase/bleomycin resistance/extradiol dioxygenase family protein [Paenibacillus sp. GSMTC-2017]|uniref:VOC family protein n=1 Tax=Paenibacillus sp. GSMTC-2017 TaxID=2794350 RepID=UPI0018D97E3D|nr:VOC family protein [Paenibacillus sp. GSMTC-2017]MBH5318283.1 glyoxalase/bleomycin resistance/extradiol dioxygenase family protein [Paenibacillus sp. GSMTC-2017]
MATVAKNIFVNASVRNVKASIAFFEAVGFEFNKQFTDDNAACLVIGENIFAMLVQEELFKTFTNKEIVNTATSAESIYALGVGSREEVDGIVSRALSAGGSAPKEPVDHGFMYSASFQDLDGHLWEVLYMEPSAVAE